MQGFLPKMRNKIFNKMSNSYDFMIIFLTGYLIFKIYLCSGGSMKFVWYLLNCISRQVFCIFLADSTYQLRIVSDYTISIHPSFDANVFLNVFYLVYTFYVLSSIFWLLYTKIQCENIFFTFT